MQLSGDFGGGAFAYQVGYFNGVTDGQSSDNLATPDVEVDTAGDYAARVFFQPFINSENFSLRGLGIRRRHDLGGCGRHRRQHRAGGLPLARPAERLRLSRQHRDRRHA